MDNQYISKIKKYFSGQPVLRAWLFGSASRGTDTRDSDIDILVCFDPEAQISLLDHVSMTMELEEILNRAVDLVTDSSLLPWVRKEVDKDKILIYERETA